MSLAHQQTGGHGLALPGRGGADAVFLPFLHPSHVRGNAILEDVSAVSVTGKHMFDFIAPVSAVLPLSPV